MSMNYSTYPDVFDDLTRLTKLACSSSMKRLLVTGLPGQGKSHTVESVIEDQFGDGYKIIQGYTTIKEFYIELYRAEMTDGIDAIIYDDCDQIFRDKIGVDILKSVLDTRHSTVSWSSRETYAVEMLRTLNSSRNADFEYQMFMDGKIPNSFTFTKTLVFISNKHVSEIDSAVVSRCPHIDVSLSRSDMLKHMKSIIRFIEPAAPINVKKEVLGLIEANQHLKPVIDLRTLTKGINYAMSEDRWEDLVVKYT